MNIGVADFGLKMWDGGGFDLDQRLRDLKSVGYAGIERLDATTEADLIQRAATFRRLGMTFTTCRAPSDELTLRWAAALGCDYVWAKVISKQPEAYFRQVSIMTEAAARSGLRVGVHNHLGTPVQSHDEVLHLLDACPETGLVFDTAHHAAAGGDPVEIATRHADRLLVIHVKDWLVVDESIGLDRWQHRGRFCELGAGNIGLDNIAVLKAAFDHGFAGPVFVEHDTHLRDPMQDLAHSRKVLADAGY